MTTPADLAQRPVAVSEAAASVETNSAPKSVADSTKSTLESAGPKKDAESSDWLRCVGDLFWTCLSGLKGVFEMLYSLIFGSQKPEEKDEKKSSVGEEKTPLLNAIVLPEAPKAEPAAKPAETDEFEPGAAAPQTSSAARAVASQPASVSAQVIYNPATIAALQANFEAASRTAIDKIQQGEKNASTVANGFLKTLLTPSLNQTVEANAYGENVATPFYLKHYEDAIALFMHALTKLQSPQAFFAGKSLPAAQPAARSVVVVMPAAAPAVAAQPAPEPVKLRDSVFGELDENFKIAKAAAMSRIQGGATDTKAVADDFVRTLMPESIVQTPEAQNYSENVLQHFLKKFGLAEISLFKKALEELWSPGYYHFFDHSNGY